MFDAYLIIDAVVVLSLLLLGLVSFIKNSRVSLNKNFVCFVFSVAIWIGANYVSNDIEQPPQIAHVANYFVFSFSYLAAYFMLRFAVNLAGSATAAKWLKIMNIPMLTVAVLSATPLVVAGVQLQEQVYAVVFGPLIVFYAIALVGTVGANIWILWRNLGKSTGTEHARTRVLFMSQIISLPILILLQFIIPALTGLFWLTNIGILAMLGIVYGLYYSAAKHKLFDIKFVVVRALVYLMSIGALLLIYSSIILFIVHRLVDIKLTTYTQVVLLISVAVSGLFFQPLRNFFDNYTGKLFYRDNYDPQILYDRLNKLLVSTLDIRRVMEQGSEIIADSLRPEYCAISLKSSDKDYRTFGTKKVDLSKHMIEELRSIAPTLRTQVIIVDYLAQQHLKGLMVDNNIAALVRLTQDVRGKKEDVGYIILGAKNSGRPYNEGDVRTLEAVANELILAIQNVLRFEEIQQFNVTLQQRVDEATRKLRVTNEKLKKLDETKDEFISMASHQLRTPLTSVKGYLSMVLEGDAGKLKPQQEVLLKQSFLSSQRMVNLIADLLNLSRINTGKFVIDASPTDLRTVVEAEMAQLQEAAKAKNIVMMYERPESFPMLMVDENKTHQVVMNFMDNAIYYTPDGGHINVSLTETPTAVEYRVKDSGIGVPRELQRHLFTKFYRADNARRMRPDGTGLGIYMAKKVILAQGGTIIFESEEGKGSTFGFRFPKQVRAVDAALVQPPAVSAEQTQPEIVAA